MCKPRNGSRNHLLARYILLAFLIVSLLGLASWAGGRLVFPSRSVTVGSAHGMQSEAIFKATGWVEPRPVPVAALTPGAANKPLVVKDPSVTAREAVADLDKDDAHHAYERALAELKLRAAELEEAEAVLTAATERLEKPVHLEVPLFEAETALAKIETEVRNVPFEVRRAEARLDFAKRDCECKTALEGVVAGRAIDQARSAFAEAASSFEELQARTDSLGKEREAAVAYRDALKTQLDLKVGEIEAKTEAEFKLKTAQARVKQAEIHLAEAKLRLDRISGQVRAKRPSRAAGSDEWFE